MNPKLDLCPFCGGTRIAIRRNGAGWSVGCQDCDVGFSVLANPEKYWNTRPVENSLRSENAKLRDQVASLESKIKSKDNSWRFMVAYHWQKSLRTQDRKHPGLPRRRIKLKPIITPGPPRGEIPRRPHAVEV